MTVILYGRRPQDGEICPVMMLAETRLRRVCPAAPARTAYRVSFPNAPGSLLQSPRLPPLPPSSPPQYENCGQSREMRLRRPPATPSVAPVPTRAWWEQFHLRNGIAGPGPDPSPICSSATPQPGRDLDPSCRDRLWLRSAAERISFRSFYAQHYLRREQTWVHWHVRDGQMYVRVIHGCGFTVASPGRRKPKKHAHAVAHSIDVLKEVPCTSHDRFSNLMMSTVMGRRVRVDPGLAAAWARLMPYRTYCSTTMSLMFGSAPSLEIWRCRRADK